MKTLMKLLFAFILAPVLSMGQGKVILINGDTLNLSVKKLSGSVLTVEMDGLEQDINLIYVHRIISNTGKEVLAKDNLYRSTPNCRYFPEEKNNYNTLYFDHSPELEAEIDAIFHKAKKFKIPYKGHSKEDISTWTNSFLSLASTSKDFMIVYVNGVKDFSSAIDRTYKLTYVHAAFGEPSLNREYLWTGHFTNSTDLKIVGKAGKLYDIKYDFKDNVLRFFNPEAKQPLVFNIAYMDEEYIKYFSLTESEFVIKQLKRVNSNTASASK